MGVAVRALAAEKGRFAGRSFRSGDSIAQVRRTRAVDKSAEISQASCQRLDRKYLPPLGMPAPQIERGRSSRVLTGHFAVPVAIANIPRRSFAARLGSILLKRMSSGYLRSFSRGERIVL
ncbi:hypothetical protein [Saccharopolyspora sp. 5N708]|uniref:hypothetical protein n=1 Tax=Saccharopolyspora sp. 5N708 TaxID=3457424 RepID=UPI003FCF40CA